LSAPGGELVLPVITSRPARFVGNALMARRGSAPQSAGMAERLEKYSALANSPGRHAFMRTLRAVVDVHGQTVCALDRLSSLAGQLPTLIVAGARDRVIPPAHAHAAHAVLSGSRLEIIDDAGHHPQLDCPATLARLIDEFVTGAAPCQLPPQSVSA
jgi:pimeloyl-ACP methyl ester carboxylesterase